MRPLRSATTRRLRALLLAATLAGSARAARPPILYLTHVNDVHGHFAADRAGDGGAALLADFSRRIRRRALAERAPLLALHAGDLFQGTALVNATRGAVVPELLRAMRLHLGVPGNHEWDYGPEGFGRLAATSRPLLLSTSIEGLPGEVHRRLVVDVGGVRVGFVGFTLPATPRKAPPGATRGLRFRAGPDALRREVEGLRARGVRCVVLVSHTFPDQDEELARELDLDLVVAGHTNDVAPPRPIPGSRAVYAQAGHHLRHAGWLRIELDPRSGRAREIRGEVVPLTRERFTPDPALARRVEALRREVLGPRADLEVELSAPLTKGAWSDHAPLVAALAHALREGAGADLAVINPSACRARSLGPGVVGYEELYAAYPYDNRVAVVEMTGAALDALYEGVARAGFRPFSAEQLAGFRAGGGPGRDLLRGAYLDDPRGILQPSGFRVRVDPEAPEGTRITLLAPSGAPLDPARTYRVATSDFLARGGDGYAALAAAPREVLDLSVRDLVISRFERAGAAAAEGPGRLENLSLIRRPPDPP